MPSLPLLPSDKPTLVGIARLASEGESIREGHDIEYFTLPARSLLNRCTGVRMPFTWTINPYRGCEFACKYCYARYTHEFMEMRDGVDFERKIYVKQHAAEMLRRELRRVRPEQGIAIGTATDPYQPAERRYEVTRAILEEMARHRGLEIGIVSKSTFLLREFPSLVEKYRRRFESKAFLSPEYHKRISQLMAKLRVKYGFQSNYERRSRNTHPDTAKGQDEQLSLF